MISSKKNEADTQDAKAKTHCPNVAQDETDAEVICGAAH
jgi:hypothetical protein